MKTSERSFRLRRRNRGARSSRAPRRRPPACTLAGCDNLSRTEWLPKVLDVGRRRVNEGARQGRRAQCDGAGVRPRRTARPRSAATARATPTRAQYNGVGASRTSPTTRSTSAACARQPRKFTLAELRATAVAHADHAPRLRRRLERDRQVEGRAAAGVARRGQGQARGALRGVLLRRPDGAPNGTDLYYESIDLDDARHEQTILAYDLNDAPLPVPNGAPLRLRVERQLGYKHAKYITGIEFVDVLRQDRRRQGRLLGRPGLPVVGGDLSGSGAAVRMLTRVKRMR